MCYDQVNQFNVPFMFYLSGCKISLVCFCINRFEKLNLNFFKDLICQNVDVRCIEIYDCICCRIDWRRSVRDQKHGLSMSLEKNAQVHAMHRIHLLIVSHVTDAPDHVDEALQASIDLGNVSSSTPLAGTTSGLLLFRLE